MAALVLIAAVSAGAFGLVREWNGQDGRWFLLASSIVTSLVIAHSRASDGSSRWTPRTVFVLFSGGLVGLVLVAVQPETAPVVALGLFGVSLVTVKTAPVKRCPECGQKISSGAGKCLACQPAPPEAEAS